MTRSKRACENLLKRAALCKRLHSPVYGDGHANFRASLPLGFPCALGEPPAIACFDVDFGLCPPL